MKDYDSNDEATAGRLAFDLGPAPLPARPVGGERHERAVRAAALRIDEGFRIALSRYFSSLVAQGVRLVEQAKCLNCEGEGGLVADGIWRKVCPRCEGSGVARMVALDEVVEFVAVEFGERPAHLVRCRFGGGER